MHIYKTLKNFLLDQDYYIDMWQNYLHIYGLKKIEVLKETLIVLAVENFNLELNGADFKVLKLTNNEILIVGNLKEMRINK